jgi:Tol biopolymer transport system component
VLTLFVAALLFYFARPAPDVVPTLAGPFRRLTTNAGLNTSPAISVDGEWVAYASDRRDGNLDIWVRQKSGEGAERQLTSGDADETEPTFSPDGKWVAFRSEEKDGGIYVISAEGGTPHLVAESGEDRAFRRMGNGSHTGSAGR